MKKSQIIIFSVLIVLAVIAVIDYRVRTYVPPVPKTINVDAEKVGKTLGDLKRDFIKGFNDTTSVKKDSIK